jgi:hypothetical protein
MFPTKPTSYHPTWLIQLGNRFLWWEKTVFCPVETHVMSSLWTRKETHRDSCTILFLKKSENWTCIFLATPFWDNAFARAYRPTWGVLTLDSNITTCNNKPNMNLSR